MSFLLRNNAEGGTNGTPVSNANMGGVSGDPCDYQFIGTGASMTFVASPGRSGVSYSFATTSSASGVFFQWNLVPNVAITYGRLYVYMDALPSGSIRVCEIIDDSVNLCFSIGIRSDGLISLRDYASAQIAVSTVKIPAKQWVRFEWKLTSHPTQGQVDFRFYREADSPYYVERMNSAATFNTQPSAGYGHIPRFGISSFSIPNFTVLLDEMAMTDTNWIGPADASATMPLFLSNNAQTAADGQVVSMSTSGNSTNRYFDSISSTGSLTFSSAQKSHGALSYYFQPANGNELKISWSGLATPSAALRFYAYFTGFPPTSTEIGQLTTSTMGAYASLARCVLASTGRINAFDSSGSLWTSTSPLSLNTWYRFEIYASLGGTATTGTFQLAFYVLDSLSPVELFSTTSANLGSVNFGNARFGKNNNNAMTEAFYMDSFAVQQQASSFIGPYASDMPAVTPYAGIVPHIGWGTKI